ncbi:MAG TPA: xanthine dehydrogenase family protein molybdopterin-binding subunit [Devosia sp.]|nr:xanthine dehydrogenase family protein molybdopterin-binding subunit [Devosia sp.]
MNMINRTRREGYGLVDTKNLPAATRRQFLKGGGMLLAFSMLGGSKALAAFEYVGGIDPKEWDEHAGFHGFAPNGFIRIGKDNEIVLIMPSAEMGQGIYTGLSMLIAEELEVGLDQIQVVPAPPNNALYAQPILKSQTTGNSTSTRAFWTPLRQAGAAARTMLVNAAAKRWKVDPATLTVARGVVTNPANGKTLKYGDLVEAASKEALPQNVALKSKDQFKLIGTPAPRVDTPHKVNGKAIYGIDVRVPGMKVGTVLASPVPGGKLVSVDDTAARKVKGVVDVLKIGNAVAVVGEHFWAAKSAADQLKITWDDGANAGVTTQQMIDAIKNTPVDGAVNAVKKGDVAAAAKTAAKTIEAAYTLPNLAHATLEPINTTIQVQKDGVDVWVGTQVPVNAQQAVAGALKLKPEQVRIHNQLIGGGYGRRLTVESIVQAALFAAQVKYPVKLIWTREEDIQHDNYRPIYYDRISAALDAEGMPVAFTDHVGGGSVLNTFIPTGLPKGALDSDAVGAVTALSYAIPNQLVDWVRVDPPINIGFWRGVGETHNSFVVESFMDELAAAAGKDPVEYRLALLKDDPRATAVIKLAADKAGWSEKLPAGSGRGISYHHAFDSPLAVIVEVSVDEQGEIKLKKIVAAVDIGVAVNPNTVKAQLEGGIIFGLSAALYNNITFDKGRVMQNNFDDYQQIRINEIPPVETYIIEGADHPGGLGESGTVSAAPALGNAIFAATGIRLRELPYDKSQLAKARAAG